MWHYLTLSLIVSGDKRFNRAYPRQRRRRRRCFLKQNCPKANKAKLWTLHRDIFASKTRREKYFYHIIRIQAID